MPQPVPEQDLPVDVSAVLTAARAGHPGLRMEVQTPTAEEVALGDAPAGHQEVNVSARFGDTSYVIPLTASDPATGALEVWQVGVLDVPGGGELKSQHLDLTSALDAAARAADQADAAALAARAETLHTTVHRAAGAVSRDGAGRDAAGRDGTSADRTGDPASTGPSRAVSNAWRSDVTAAAEVQATAPTVDNPPDALEAPALRAEEIELVERVDPDQADVLAAGRVADRGVGGRQDWAHRRPERAAEQPTPGRDRSR